MKSCLPLPVSGLSKIRTEILTFHVSTETRSTPQGTMWRPGAHSKWILMEVVSLETQALTPGLLLWKHVILQMVQSNSLHLNLIDVFYVYLHCRRLRHTWVCLFVFFFLKPCQVKSQTNVLPPPLGFRALSCLTSVELSTEINYLYQQSPWATIPLG